MFLMLKWMCRVLISLLMPVVVASQCLESAYGISIRDVDALTLYPLPAPLRQIFSAGLNQMVGIHY